MSEPIFDHDTGSARIYALNVANDSDSLLHRRIQEGSYSVKEAALYGNRDEEDEYGQAQWTFAAARELERRQIEGEKQAE